MDAELELLDASLPGTLPVVPGLALAARYVLTDSLPTHRGDGMKVISLPGPRVALMVGDVVGSGAVASTTMARLLTILRDRLQEGESALGAVRYADRYAATAPQAIGATVAVVVIALHDGTYEYAAAGHPAPLHWSRHGASTAAMPSSRPLGTGGQRTSATGQLAPDEVIVLYTDGLLTSRGEGLTDAHARLHAALGTAAIENPYDDDKPDLVCRQLLSEVIDSNRLADDVALLVAERTSRPPPLSASGRATSSYVAELADTLEGWLDGIGAGLLDHLALRQAFTELANNVVQHAYSGRPVDDTDNTLSLRAELSDTGVVQLDISDTGHWADGLGRPGRGLIIAGGLVDSLQLNRRDVGTTITLRQELGRPVPVLQASQLPSVDRSNRPAHPSLSTRMSGRRLVVTGEVEERCTSEFRESIHVASRAATVDTVVDLSEVTLLASSAVRVLFDFMERARASSVHLTVTAARDSVAEHVLRLVDLPHSVS